MKFFGGEVEVDESQFGGMRKGSNAEEVWKNRVLCLLKRGERGYTKIIS